MIENIYLRVQVTKKAPSCTIPPVSLKPSVTLKQQIRRDAKLLAGDPEALALLECLVQHLFDLDLDAAYLARVSGARRQTRRRLRAKLGPLKNSSTSCA